MPVSAIVGSVDRYHDFSRAFLPIQTQTRPRWESVDRAALTDVALPPIQVYKVGSAYFVKDGKSMKHVRFTEEWVKEGDPK